MHHSGDVHFDSVVTSAIETALQRSFLCKPCTQLISNITEAERATIQLSMCGLCISVVNGLVTADVETRIRRRMRMTRQSRARRTAASGT